MGKLSSKELENLLSCIRKDSRVIIPPMVGFDSGVHRLNGKYMVVASDPCTGVPEDWFGYLLINYAASDLSLSGAKPEFCTINLLGPRSTETIRFQEIMRQTCKAADELNIAIIRGHTGTYDSLNDILGVCTVYGTLKPEELITPAKAKANDLILCTKPLSYETVTNFSVIQKEKAKKIFGAKKAHELAKQVPMQSCVKEALALSKIEGVNAMHDATEGGLVAALNELSEASAVGFRVNFNSIPLLPEILALKTHFELSDEQVLASSSTGTILAAVNPGAKKEVTKILAGFGLKAYFIGQFTEEKNKILLKEEIATAFPSMVNDPYATIIA